MKFANEKISQNEGKSGLYGKFHPGLSRIPLF
jgi:hypothetical protein